MKTIIISASLDSDLNALTDHENKKNVFKPAIKTGFFKSGFNPTKSF